MNSLSQLLAKEKQFKKLPSSLQFVKAFLSDVTVASIAPSSAVTIEELGKLVDFPNVQMAVELGAGDGAVTSALIEHIRPEALLHAIEVNQSLAQILDDSIADRRLKVVHGDARDYFDALRAKGIQADLVVSGIPFSLLSTRSARKLLRDIADSLAPDGQFILYQTWLPPLFTSRRLKRLLRKDFEIDRTVNVYRNLPPLQIISVKKRGERSQIPADQAL